MKFGRRCQLSIEVNPNSQGVTQSNVVIPEEMTIEFDITRQDWSSTQEATFRIHGLSEKTRNLLYKDQYAKTEYRAIQFRAGYEDFLPLCFNGFVFRGDSYKISDTWITEITAYDGGLAMANGFVAQTVVSGQTVGDTLKFLASQLPSTTGNPIIGSFPQTNSRGKVLFGNTWQVIMQETNRIGMIDNGQVKILNYFEALSAEIPVIDSTSGLLGSPRRGTTSLEFRMLFEPRLTLGQLVELRSVTNKIFNGLYKVLGFTHQGIISQSVAGECITNARLFYGDREFRLVTGNLVQ